MEESRYAHLFGTRNQLANVHNFYQGSARRALFLCSAGLLRSATASHIFSAEPYNWNTRSAGVAVEYALNPVSQALLEWAHVIYCMEDGHVNALKDIFGEKFEYYIDKVKVLGIRDCYAYRDPDLIDALKIAVNSLEDLEKHESKEIEDDF